ncbi:MAG: glutamate synthase subunit beta [Anaerolineales bacterium]|nr:glutamate synthase subunit beta [Anaerolineales bacterium]
MSNRTKATGFMKFERQAPAKRPALERVRDWQPLQLRLPDETLREQAARCMDCGIPFCHQGRILNRMTTGCPLNNLIPEWNDLVYRGLWRDAYDRLSRTNNFPEFTGLACPAPCEASCTLGMNQPAVTIKSLEYAIIERAFTEGWVQPETPPKRTGKRVAVVGSGPAGLACADQLNKAGHTVTVYERADRIGGLLMYGIPNMKLEKKLVERRVELLRQAGIQFVTDANIGVNVPVETLQAEHDAIILCTGATQARDLPLPGRELGGVHFAMEYLTGATRQFLTSGSGADAPISAADRDVIVIGGGDTGTDCVGTALRQGSRSLVQFEILPQPPHQRAPDNPWPQWPLIFKPDYGQEEAAALHGEDPRQFSLLTKALVGDETGRICGLETVEIVWEGAEGQRQFREKPGSERFWPAQLVLLAMGFLGPEQNLPGLLGVTRTERSNIQTDQNGYQTNVPHVFAAGDARRGQSLVVWAIKEGRAAARECDLFLMGETDLY